MSILNGIPGTETNVTPEIDVPIIPNATKNQGDCFPPKKNVSLSLLRPVKCRNKHQKSKIDDNNK